MKGHFLSEKLIEEFGKHLVLEEKSEHTVEKYLRDVRAFAAYAGQAEISKELAICYKQHLLESDYAVRSINSMLASLNSLFDWLGWHECRVKALKTQKQIFCPEEKELTKAEYLRLVNTAKQNGNERLYGFSFITTQIDLFNPMRYRVFEKVCFCAPLNGISR